MNTNSINKTHLSRRAVVYVRHSGARQVDMNTSAYSELARFHGWTTSKIVLIDDSGFSSSLEKVRAGFEKLKRLVRTKKAGAVIIPATSRLSRDSSQLNE